MDYQTVTTLIGSFGFPIFMCIIMAWYINNTHKELINVMYSINRTLKAVITKLGLEDGDKNE